MNTLAAANGRDLWEFLWGHLAIWRLRLGRRGREAPLDDPEETERYRAIVDDPQASEPEKRVALAVLAARGF
jgi:hypothetical protein